MELGKEFLNTVKVNLHFQKEKLKLIKAILVLGEFVVNEDEEHMENI